MFKTKRTRKLLFWAFIIFLFFLFCLSVSVIIALPLGYDLIYAFIVSIWIFLGLLVGALLGLGMIRLSMFLWSWIEKGE